MMKSSTTKTRLIIRSITPSFQRRFLSYSRSSLSSAPTSTSSSSTTPKSKSNLTTYTSLLSLGIFTGILTSYIFPRPDIIKFINPLPTAIQPLIDSEEGKEWTEKIEMGIQELGIVKDLRTRLILLDDQVKVKGEMVEGGSSPIPLTSLETPPQQLQTKLIPAYTESRPYATSQQGPHSLSATTLRGPGKFAVAPLVFTSRDKKESIFILHLGDGLCGHEGVVHGGLLATVLDESLARTAFLSLPNNIGVTATLSLSYKKPTFANQYVVIKTSMDKLKGRKAWVKGAIEDLNGNVLVTAEALFVEPKMAKFLNSSSIREHLK